MNRTSPSVPFETLVRDHHADVYRAALRLTRNDADARDVAQEVFLRVLEGKLEIEDEAGAGKILRSWAVNGALQRLRAGKRRMVRERRHVERSAKESVDPAERAEASERELLCWREVSSLPEELRVPLVLRVCEGLGFARIAELVGASESTAHDRVRRGLDRLRSTLGALGVVCTIRQIEGALERTPAAPTPVGLAERLLELDVARNAFVSSSVLVGSSVVVGALAVGVLIWSGGTGEPDEPVVAVAGAAVVRSAESIPLVEASASADGGSADGGSADGGSEDGGSARRTVGSTSQAGGDFDASASGVVVGRVLDEAGRPLRGVRVSATSTRLTGKTPARHLTTTTDEDGRFRFEVPVPAGERPRYIVRAIDEGFVPAATESKEVSRGSEADFGALHLGSRPEPEVAPWSLDLQVVDEVGQPIPDVRVDLRSVDRESDRTEFVATAKSDGVGLVALQGEWTGPMRLVLAPDARFAPQRVEFEAAGHASISLVVALEPGRIVSGIVRPVPGTEAVLRPDEIWIETLQPATSWSVVAEIEPDGSFRIEGLEAGPHRLRVGNDLGRREGIGWSPHTLSVQAGTSDLVLELKRADDPRDVGLHGGELHGSLWDAVEGRELRQGDVELEWVSLDTAEPGALERDLLPLHAFPSRAQRMELAGANEAEGLHVHGIERGTYLLAGFVRDRAPAFVGPLEFGLNEVKADVRLEFGQAQTVSGQVLDPSGAPVPGAWIALLGDGERSRRLLGSIDERLVESGGAGTIPFRCVVRADERGRFRIEGAPAGVHFQVRALSTGHLPGPSVPHRCAPGESPSQLGLRLGPPR